MVTTVSVSPRSVTPAGTTMSPSKVMDPITTLLNGQPVPTDIVELATDDTGVNTAIVAFLHRDYVRSAENDTQIRRAMTPDEHEADTLIVAPPTTS